MGKTKPNQPAKASKSKKDAEAKAISSVKEGAIIKPSQTPKSKSKEIAKQVAVKAQQIDKPVKGDKKSKKVKKEPTPEPSSSESESDDEMASASSASSEDESESEVEVPKQAAKTNGAKVNGKPKAVAKAEVESSPSSASSDDEDDDEEEEEDAIEAKPAAPKSAHAAKVVQAKEESDSDEESGSSEGGSEDDSEEDDGEDSEEDSEDELEDEKKVKGPVDAKALNGALAKVASDQVTLKLYPNWWYLSCH